jgi:hypothetical protein
MRFLCQLPLTLCGTNREMKDQYTQPRTSFKESFAQRVHNPGTDVPLADMDEIREINLRAKGGKVPAFLLSQNLALKIMGTVLSTSIILVLLWTSSEFDKSERRNELLEQQVMASNNAHLRAIRRTRDAIQVQAFAKQNIRAQQSLKVSSSKLYRIFGSFEKSVSAIQGPEKSAALKLIAHKYMMSNLG